MYMKFYERYVYYMSIWQYVEFIFKWTKSFAAGYYRIENYKNLSDENELYIKLANKKTHLRYVYWRKFRKMDETEPWFFRAIWQHLVEV